MPKKVDHQKRKIEIAEAAWKVIVEEGLEEASVRKIAETADLSVGALRYYFSSQSDLLYFSMEHVTERVKKRTETKSYRGEPMEMFTELICEVLPVDKERKIEMEVWLVFSAKTLVDKKLQSLGEKVYEEMHDGLRKVLNSMMELEMTKDGIELEIEVDRLHVLVDGLAMHHLLYPENFTYEKMIHTLKYHLQSICRKA